MRYVLRMRFFAYFVISFLSITAFAQTVLITGFKPFGGRGINTSYQVAKAIQENLKASYIQAVICELPVSYNEVFPAARDCYEKLERRPDMVISLGEQYSGFEFAHAAKNFAGHEADEDSRIWGNRVILENHADQIRFTLPVESLYCSLPKDDRQDLSIANHPGIFVCNFLAYKMADYLQPTQVPYTFIHVPVLALNQKRQLHQIADRISQIIYTQMEGPPHLDGDFYTQCSEEYQEKKD